MNDDAMRDRESVMPSASFWVLPGTDEDEADSERLLKMGAIPPRKRFMKLRKHRGFSLLELLITIAIGPDHGGRPLS